MESYPILGYLFAGLLGLIFLKKTICKKKKKNWSTFGQLPWPHIKAQAPGHGAPLLAGVRVVEIASVAAAPSCSRIFADRMCSVLSLPYHISLLFTNIYLTCSWSRGDKSRRT